MPATTYQLTLAFPDFSQYKVSFVLLSYCQGSTSKGPTESHYHNDGDDGVSNAINVQVNDLFRGLGPVAVFSAKHHWTAPRTIQLRKKEVKIKSSFKKEKQTHHQMLRTRAMASL